MSHSIRKLLLVSSFCSSAQVTVINSRDAPPKPANVWHMVIDYHGTGGSVQYSCNIAGMQGFVKHAYDITLQVTHRPDGLGFPCVASARPISTYDPIEEKSYVAHVHSKQHGCREAAANPEFRMIFGTEVDVSSQWNILAGSRNELSSTEIHT